MHQHEYPEEEELKSRLQKVDHLVFTYEVVDQGELKGGDAQNRGFNDRGEMLTRETIAVDSIKEMVEKINDYSYSPSLPGRLCGIASMVVSCSLFYWCRRRIIPEGYLGHYRTSGMHKVREPGFSALYSCTEWWEDDIRIDGNDKRGNQRTIIPVGSKSILIVPENHLAGAYRICEEEVDGGIDGEYVIFPQGRYVIENDTYRTIKHVSLKVGIEQTKLKLGPLTIVYIREGFLGGAYKINEGKYIILHPGPPYVLHEKDYEEISVKQISKVFSLGPLHFVTVRDGMMAGAYRRETTDYHILPPGKTYMLHSKEYDFQENEDICARSDLFKLGPWFFVTVKEGFVAGAFKRIGGAWVNFPPGKTYQLNTDEYEKPILKKLDRAIVRCGPMTFLTVQENKLAGAWRIADGHFELFKNHDRCYSLSEADYHSLEYINKYSNKVQSFGPYKVVTIPEGWKGVFEKSGKLEIQDPGFYMESFESIIRENIPVNTSSLTLNSMLFLSKDGTKMSSHCTLVWRVENVEHVALIAKSLGSGARGFKMLLGNIQNLVKKMLDKYCKTYNRAQLLPTKQDIIVKAGDIDDEKIKEMLLNEIQQTASLYKTIEKQILTDIIGVSLCSQWGIKMCSLKLEGFETLDVEISKKLSDITFNLLKESEERINGDLEIVKAEISKAIRLKELETTNFVRTQVTKADAEVRKINAEGKAKKNKIESEAEANTHVIELRAENEVTVLNATTNALAHAAAKKIELEIECKEQKSKAQAESSAIELISKALYFEKCKINEAATKMSKKQFALEKAEVGVQAMEKIGQAQWRMPNKILQFYESFTPYLRMGPMTAREVLNNLDDQKPLKKTNQML